MKRNTDKPALDSVALAALFNKGDDVQLSRDPHQWTRPPGAAPAVFDDKAPRMVIAYGRSRLGKSLVLEFLGEEAQRANRPVLLADFDRDNPSLAARFGTDMVVRPATASLFHFEEGFKRVVAIQAETRCDALVDIGFGSARDFRALAARLNLQSVVEQSGTRPVLLMPLGSNRDDLDVIRALDGVFVPDDVLLIVNEGLLDPDENVESAFRDVLDDPHIVGLLQRKARLIRILRLPGGVRFHNSKLPFRMAYQPVRDNPLDMFERAAAKLFLEHMDKVLAAHRDILPI